MTSQPELSPQPERSDFVENPLRIRCVELVEVVTHYLDGALDAGDHEAVDRHLAGCENCVIFVSQIQMTVTLSAEIGQRIPVELPGNLVELSSLIAGRKAHG